ncbi:MAG TPA: beta-ketoacyl synthase N-terminal-like domain-containing protein [Vicinamibacteria bacterium]|nr:beta-ketoacyl synthase N-terminal-like domain-containing protein [Vicinamibacteria bacterium]
MATAVVTGVGVVGSFGCGLNALAEALRASRPVLSEVDRSAGYHLPESARTAALIGAADLTTWVPPASARRMSPPSKVAVAAARMATAEAGGDGEAGLTEVVLATAFGPASFTERMLRGLLAEGPETASPFLFTECVANAPAAQVAIAGRARGPNITVTQREAGPLLALGRAAADVATGSVERALTGAVDESPPLVHALLDRYRALSRPGADGGEAARPFDRRRSGFCLGEGATVLVVEEEAAARTRGARILARVWAWGSAFDPSASRVSWGQGHEPLARAARRMLDRASLAPSDIDLIVSGASGSVAGDRLEAATLHALWGEAPLPPVLAPKSVTGEYGGAQLAAAILATAGAEFGPTAGFETFDPELRVIPHAGGPLPLPRRVLVSSLAGGGAAAWVVLERL